MIRGFQVVIDRPFQSLRFNQSELSPNGRILQEGHAHPLHQVHQGKTALLPVLVVDGEHQADKAGRAPLLSLFLIVHPKHGLKNDVRALLDGGGHIRQTHQVHFGGPGFRFVPVLLDMNGENQILYGLLDDLLHSLEQNDFCHGPPHSPARMRLISTSMRFSKVSMVVFSISSTISSFFIIPPPEGPIFFSMGSLGVP